MTCATQNNKGYMLIQVIVFGSIAILFLTGLISWAGLNIREARQAADREQSLQIAEAGVEYYRWHLAHAPQDYRDGSTTPGTYVHPFYDKDGVRIGEFQLDIVAPLVGSTLVTVRSKGILDARPTIYRRLEAKLAIPSLAKYAVVSNSNVRFGEGTEIWGPIHSNGGIRFDGLAHNTVTSAVASYDDPDHGGGVEFGVHTHVGSNGVSDNSFRPAESPPPPAPTRSDVFLAGRQFPVPSVDFNGITSNLAQMKTDAQANGRYLAASGALGYHLVLKTNDTFDVYRVNSLYPAPNNCTNVQGESGWGTWSINTTGGAQTLLANYPFPSNGIVFVEDNVWVDGQINTARITIASARFPDNASTRTSITVNSDLRYTNYDGQDVIALMAQNNFNVGLVSADILRIDAAIVAQNGRAGRYYYQAAGNSQNRCAPYHTRQQLTLYGTIASNQRYGFAFSDGTGYDVRNISYDANLLYGPPPSFPLTSDQYSIVSWKEIK